MVIPVMLRLALPVFERVMLWAALLVPTVCDEKVRLVGERLTAGAEPEPFNEIFDTKALLPFVVLLQVV
jgi:hypothetical protein